MESIRHHPTSQRVSQVETTAEAEAEVDPIRAVVPQVALAQMASLLSAGLEPSANKSQKHFLPSHPN
jgi:hypothetical protein